VRISTTKVEDAFSREYQKFSEVSSLLNWLCTMSIHLTFEIFYQQRLKTRFRESMSRLCSEVNSVGICGRFALIALLSLARLLWHVWRDSSMCDMTVTWLILICTNALPSLARLLCMSDMTRSYVTWLVHNMWHDSFWFVFMPFLH